MSRWSALGLIIALAWLVCACNGSSKTDGSTTNGDGPNNNKDSVFCRRPPTIKECFEPPHMYHDTIWYCDCVGTCGGGSFTAACDDSTNDCRYFYSSCIPETYARCDENASDRVLGLCGQCFFTEAGTRPVDKPLPEVCDKLYLDGGVTVNDLGDKDQAGKDAAVDAPAKDAVAKDTAAKEASSG